MSPLQELVLPDALHSPNQGRILPGDWLKHRVQEQRRELLSFLFFAYNCLPFVGNLSLTTYAPSLTFILFSTRCALCHSLFHSQPPPLSFPLTDVDYLSLFCCSLFLVRCLPLSGKQVFLSDQPTLCPFTVSSLSSARLLLFISLAAIIFPFNSDTLCFHSALLTVSIWMNTSHCVFPLLFLQCVPILKPPFTHCTICIC